METDQPVMQPWDGADNDYIAKRFKEMEDYLFADVDIDTAATNFISTSLNQLGPVHENDLKKAIADRLRARRIYLRFTQHEAAEAVGIKRATYAAYELGYNPIPSTDMPRIAKAMQCSLGYLYGEEELVQTGELSADAIIANMALRFFHDLPAPARARALRLLVERYATELAAPGLSGRWARENLFEYGRRYSLTQFIQQLELDEKAAAQDSR